MISKSKIFLGGEVDKNPTVIDPRRSPDLMSCRIDDPLGALTNKIGIAKRSNVGEGQAIVAIHQLGKRVFFLGNTGVGTLPGRLWLVPVMDWWYGYEYGDLAFHFFDDSEGVVDTPTYHWDFGDGNTSTDKNPEHIYASEDDIPDSVKQVITDGDGTVHEKEQEIDLTGIGGAATSYPVVDSVTPSEVAYEESASLVIAGSNFPKFKVRRVIIYNATTVIYPSFKVDSGNQITVAYGGSLPVGTYTIGVLLYNGHYGELVDGLEIGPMEDTQVSSANPDLNYETNITLLVRIQHRVEDVSRSYIKTPQYTDKVLSVYCNQAYTDGLDHRIVGAYTIDPDLWEEDTLTWNNQPAIGSLLDSNMVDATGWYNFAIGSAKSVCLKYVDEVLPSKPPNRTIWVQFRSRDYGDSDYHPYVTEA